MLTTPIGLSCKHLCKNKTQLNANKYIKTTIITTAFWILFTIHYKIITFGSADVGHLAHKTSTNPNQEIQANLWLAGKFSRVFLNPANTIAYSQLTKTHIHILNAKKIRMYHLETNIETAS